MGQSIVATQADFETAVLKQSFQHPVLVDFYATWCGPCQLLKPMLEKLVAEYDFTLAKVDIDQNPDLAKTFGVEGVPDVRIVNQGQVLDGFVGVLPEPDIRALLANLGLQSSLEQGLAAFKALQATGPAEAAQAALTTLLTQHPENPQVLLTAAQVYLHRGDCDTARQYLDLIQAPDRPLQTQVEGWRELLALQPPPPAEAAESPLDADFETASKAALEGDYATALETFLALVQTDRRYRNDGARKAMLTVFKLLGDSDPLTATYRKRLMQALY
ncbi:MAG: tetratricopeptide repeat protein [Nodosilinea sp.]